MTWVDLDLAGIATAARREAGSKVVAVPDRSAARWMREPGKRSQLPASRLVTARFALTQQVGGGNRHLVGR